MARLTSAQVENCDIGALNLACADGLPGAEEIDHEGCLQCLDDWAVGIGELTEKGVASTFRDDPGRYRNSEPLYRMVSLVMGLRRFCGVRYNPSKVGIDPNTPFDLDEQFVHGPIQGPGGTCATLPVLYAAVGRRLGYPIRLVQTRRHMFCRWDDPAAGVSLNIEGTNLVGMDSYPDDHYRAWPDPVTDEEVRVCGYLRSLTPRQELACFVSRRGVFWRQRGNYRRAMDAYLLAMALDPTGGRVNYARLLSVEWERTVFERRPPRFPRVELRLHPARARWRGMPQVSENRLRFIEAVENLLNDPELEARWWAPLRAGRAPAVPLPRLITVDCTGEELCSTHP